MPDNRPIRAEPEFDLAEIDFAAWRMTDGATIDFARAEPDPAPSLPSRPQ